MRTSSGQVGVGWDTTGNEGRKTGEGKEGEQQEEEKEFAVMCLSSFSIYTEALFIRLKSIIYAAAGEKNNGGNINIDSG